MGSFNVKCGATGYNIQEGDGAVLIFLRPTPRGFANQSIEKALGQNLVTSVLGAQMFFQPDSMPIRVTYDDYGRFVPLSYAPHREYAQQHVASDPLDLATWDGRIDTKKHSVFVVREDAFYFLTSPGKYDDPLEEDIHFELIEMGVDYIVEPTVPVPDHEILEKEDVIRWVLDHRWNDVHLAVYRDITPLAKRWHKELYMLSMGLTRLGRVFQVPYYGEQERNYDFVTGLYKHVQPT